MKGLNDAQIITILFRQISKNIGGKRIERRIIYEKTRFTKNAAI